ncbi:hypothetical protein SEVIR_2G307225v4 [Setaria viridis]
MKSVWIVIRLRVISVNMSPPLARIRRASRARSARRGGDDFVGATPGLPEQRGAVPTREARSRGVLVARASYRDPRPRRRRWKRLLQSSCSSRAVDPAASLVDRLPVRGGVEGNADAALALRPLRCFGGSSGVGWSAPSRPALAMASTWFGSAAEMGKTVVAECHMQ